MGKVLSLTFSINGIVNRGFNSSMSTASRGLINLQSQSQMLKGKLHELDSALYKNEIDFEGYAQKANKVKNQLKQLELQQEKLNRVLTAKNNLKGAVADLGAFSIGMYAASRPIVGIIKTAADFEETMSRVKAITRANTEEMSQLTNEAKRLGRETPFTARQTAEAMTYLGMAGWQTKQILEGMPGLLNLALAGKTGLARTADIISDDLTAFGLEADKAQHMADVFAYTITRTNTDVEKLGETMKYAAPVAHAFGASLEETAALAGLMANGSIKASQAGTSLRMGFLRLAGPPKKAAKALDELGISLSDATKAQEEAHAAIRSLGIEMSNTKGPKTMLQIIKELREKLNQLDKRERLDLAQKIFGVNAASGWLNVLDAPIEKFAELVNEMDKCDGESARLAKTMTDNTVGAFTKLQSATEGIALAVGSVFLPPLAEAGLVLSDYATVIGAAAEKHPVLIKTVGAIGVTMAGTALAVKLASVGYAAYQVAAAAATAGTWAFNTALLANPIGLVVVGIAGLIAAGYMLYKNWDTVSTGLVNGWNWIKDTAYNFLSDLPNKAGYAVGYVVGWFMKLPDRLLGIISSLGTVGASFISQAKEWGSQGVTGLIDSFLSLPGKLYGIVSAAWEKAKGAFSRGMNDAGTTSPTAQVAANAKGGIYNKGAFLTTFAEESPEAAIPIDGSERAKRLWIRTGQMLGLLQQPKRKSKATTMLTTDIQREASSAPLEHKPKFEIPQRTETAKNALSPLSVPGIFGALLKTMQKPKEKSKPMVTQTTNDYSIITPLQNPKQQPDGRTLQKDTTPVQMFDSIALPRLSAATSLINSLQAKPDRSPDHETNHSQIYPDKMTAAALGECSLSQVITLEPLEVPPPMIQTNHYDAGLTALANNGQIARSYAVENPAPATIEPSIQNTPFERLSNIMRSQSEAVTNERTVNITYSPSFTPTFNITGPDTAESIKGACDKIFKMSMQDFRNMWERFAKEQRRVAYD